MAELPDLLPLGSAVEIENDDGLYIIIARGLQKQDDGFLAGYKAVPHPQGAAAGVREIVIRQSQIVEVVHRGHENRRDAAYARDLLETAKAPPPAPAPPPPEPDLTVAASAPATAPTDAVTDPRDPFKELRSKGKST